MCSLFLLSVEAVADPWGGTPRVPPPKLHLTVKFPNLT